MSDYVKCPCVCRGTLKCQSCKPIYLSYRIASLNTIEEEKK